MRHLTEQDHIRLETDGLAFRRDDCAARLRVAGVVAEEHAPDGTDRDHRQSPVLGLTAVAGDAMAVEDLECDALDELRDVAEKHLSRLNGSGSPLLRYLASVQSNATGLRCASPPLHVRLV
jgi:hypothetical protein